MTFLTIGNRLAQDPSFAQWLVRIQRYGAAPGDLIMFSRVWFSTDARSALPAIQVPTLVLVREGWPSDAIEESMWTADQIPGAQLLRLHGDEDDPYLGDVTEVAEAVGRFISSIREEQAVFDRVLATVLFTDIVGSTERASAMGDRAWKDLVEQHHAKTGRCSRGSVGTRWTRPATGSSRRSTVRAERCVARRRSSRGGPDGIEVRAGVHTGEVRDDRRQGRRHRRDDRRADRRARRPV